MMKFIYKGVLTLNATLLFVFIYFIKEKIMIPFLGGYISILLYVGIIVIFTLICIRLTACLPSDVIEGDIQEITMANNSFMPSYLGYFFVALSLPLHSYFIAIVVYIIIWIFTFLSQSLYFNPLFLLFGYHFYRIRLKDNRKIFVISKKKPFQAMRTNSYKNLKRINDFTFIDKE